jgi:cell wall-associated NlpC family hydrolase
MSLELDMVQKYLGIPYAHHGRDMKGLDCWGLILLVYKDLGHQLIDIEKYDKDWANKGDNFFVENYHGQWEKVSAPRLFDIALFCNNKGIACHAGLYIREGSIMHSLEKVGVALTKYSRVNTNRHLDGFYRMIEK